MADEEKKDPAADRRAKMYDAKKPAAAKAPEPAAEAAAPAEPAAEAAAAAKPVDPLKEMAKSYMEKHAALAEAHASEARDFHGNQRNAIKQMTDRHSKAYKALMDEHFKELGGGEPPAEAAPAAESAKPAAAAGASE